MGLFTLVSKVVFLIAVSGLCYADEQDKEKPQDIATPLKSAVQQSNVHFEARSAVEPHIIDSATKSAIDISAGEEISSTENDSESRGHGIKIKKKKPKLKKAKKYLKKFLPFLLIPLLIQAKLIPLFLFKLKLIALKAFGVGKLALLLIAINMIYTLLHKGSQDQDQHYSKEVLASEHYGYNGGPEYGAWVNKRLFNVAQP
ncbi:uncharacterized protein LOC128995999 [Macrosteles quadrilineatus]|uniref:uncharacterized protein LOC128995999 n=1 Tax=Macrosteles quadrilineatus TaxID=74068 RepID=UPI0023E2F62C|nr:uncharacterized protein LOC128995999 [Macrosteles quadrilineatus]